MPKIPSVTILDAIKPTNAGTGEDALVYHSLANAVERYRPTNAARSAAVWDSERGGIEEHSKARQLASEYFLRTALKVVTSRQDNHDLWADRFTQATVELYGEPDAEEAAQLLRSEYDLLSQLLGRSDISQQHVNFLLDTYRPMLADNADIATDESAVENEKEAIREYGEAMLAKYKPLFDLVDKSEKHEYSPKDLLVLFNAALEWLKENDGPEWSEWTIVEVEGTALSVNASTHRVNIASRREPATAKEARGLIAHELLVHALRGKNGYKTGDETLARGFPDCLEAEEGLGILSEAAINSELPDKAYDRYVDIALALGSVDGVQRSRQEVYKISFARQLIRSQLVSTLSETDIPALERRVQVHVDRIYRGGRGDNSGTRQAIFTKDIAYYVGYKKMAEYISGQIASGKTAYEVFEYLAQAKFDPTNPKHVERLNKSKT